MVFALGTVSIELKGGSYRRGLSMLTHGSYQPKMAEKDKHINQGDSSLLPILSHSLPLKKRKHVEVFFFSIAAPRIGACRSREGNKVARGFQQPVISGEGKSI